MGAAALGLSSCETYEFPPRLHGVGTENCPACEVFVLEESRFPLGGVASLSSRFAFEDSLGALREIRVFVTTPSGRVVEELVDEEDMVSTDADGDAAGGANGEADADGEPDTDGESDTEGNPEPEPEPGDTATMRPGFTCEFEGGGTMTAAATCFLSSPRDTSGESVSEVLHGVERGTLSVDFGVELTEVGEWTVEVEAERTGGTRSNRLSTTFVVVEDIGDDDDGEDD
ncbi:MAG: hypothetical protein ACRBN8_10905 [Nannocystales bacterium]